MKLTKDDFPEIIELLGASEEFKPILQEILKTVQSYAGEFKETIEDFQDWIIESRIRAFDKYRRAKFSREESLLLVLNARIATEDALNRMNKINTK